MFVRSVCFLAYKILKWFIWKKKIQNEAVIFLCMVSIFSLEFSWCFKGDFFVLISRSLRQFSWCLIFLYLFVASCHFLRTLSQPATWSTLSPSDLPHSRYFLLQFSGRSRLLYALFSLLIFLPDPAVSYLSFFGCFLITPTQLFPLFRSWCSLILQIERKRERGADTPNKICLFEFWKKNMDRLPFINFHFDIHNFYKCI